LIFVSVSLNLQRILANKHLPERALEALILLANILIVSSLLLIPGQSPFGLGSEIIILDVLLWITVTKLDFKMYRSAEKRFKRNYRQNIVFSQIALFPFLAAGILLILNPNIGIYMFIPGITFSFIKSLVDSWVLLVEINR